MRTETMEAPALQDSANNLAVITGLIQTCRESQAGFLNAAEYVRNSDLRAYFIARAMERARFAAELDRVSHSLGETGLSPAAPMSGRIHRAWMDLRLARRTDGGVLNSVASAVRIARDFYRQALSLDFPPPLQAVLRQQAESVSDTYDQVQTLRDMRGRIA